MSGQDDIEARCRGRPRPTSSPNFERRAAPREDAADLLGGLDAPGLAQRPLGARRRRAAADVRCTASSSQRACQPRSAQRPAGYPGWSDRIRGVLPPSFDDSPDESEGAAVRDLVERLPEGRIERSVIPARALRWTHHCSGRSMLDLNASTARSRYAAAREILQVDHRRVGGAPSQREPRLTGGSRRYVDAGIPARAPRRR